MTDIIVTGGAGYIGSHICKRLIKDGYHPIIIDNLSTGNRAALDRLGIVNFEPCDIGNVSKVEEILKRTNAKSVIHLAAYSSVEESVANPDTYFKNNVEDSCLFLKTCLDNGIENFIFSSSAAVYGDTKQVVTERQKVDPINPYGETKAAFEYVLKDLAPSYKEFRSISLRYFNVCGCDPEGELGSFHEKETHIIPLLCRSVINGTIFTINGRDFETKDGTAIRDYVDISDLVEAHILSLKALENGKPSATYNVGTNAGFSVKQICQLVYEQDQNLKCRIGERRVGDPAKLVASYEKIRSELNWSPQVSLRESIRLTYEWEKSRNKDSNKEG